MLEINIKKDVNRHERIFLNISFNFTLYLENLYQAYGKENICALIHSIGNIMAPPNSFGCFA